MMTSLLCKTLVIACLFTLIAPMELFAQSNELGTLPPPRKLTESQAKLASANYQKYCALCHGADLSLIHI